jgi:hypothetical protein
LPPTLTQATDASSTSKPHPHIDCPCLSVRAESKLIAIPTPALRRSLLLAVFFILAATFCHAAQASSGAFVLNAASRSTIALHDLR